MNELRRNTIVRHLFVPMVTLQAFLLSTAASIAQETKDVNVDINLKGNGASGWYTMWWVWVIIAVFIIVIVALTTRGGSSRQD